MQLFQLWSEGHSCLILQQHQNPLVDVCGKASYQIKLEVGQGALEKQQIGCGRPEEGQLWQARIQNLGCVRSSGRPRRQNFSDLIEVFTKLLGGSEMESRAGPHLSAQFCNICPEIDLYH